MTAQKGDGKSVWKCHPRLDASRTMILPDQPRTAVSQSILHRRHCRWTLRCSPSTCESLALTCSDIGRQLSELAHIPSTRTDQLALPYLSQSFTPDAGMCVQGHRYVSNARGHHVFHAAAVCLMRSLCVRCRHGVFDAGTLQHLKAWMRSPHDSSCTGRWSVVDCTEGRRQKCVEVSSTTRCKPYHDTARSAPHCRISVNPSPPTLPLDSTVFSIDVRVSRTHLQRHRTSVQHATGVTRIK